MKFFPIEAFKMAENDVRLSVGKLKRYNLRSSVTMSSPVPDDIVDNPPAAKRMRYNLRDSHRGVALAEPKRKLPAKKNLMNLDNYCLLELFEWLPPNDLRNVSQVNVRLNDLIIRYARLKCGHAVKSDAIFDFKTSDDCWMTRQAVQLCLTILGHQIHILKFMGHCWKLYWNLIRCKVFFNWNFNECSAVNSVIFENLYSPSDTSLVMFSGLEQLRIKNVNAGNDTIMQLLRRNPTLKKLSIVNGGQSSTYCFVQVFKLRDLEEFEFKKWRQSRPVTDLDLRYLLAFKKLKVLKFGFEGNTYSALNLLRGFAEEGIELDHLELANGHIADGSAEALARLKTIKTLKLNKMCGLLEEHVVHIAQQLKLLEVFHVRSDAIISPNCIHQIVDAATRLSCFKIDAMGVEMGPEIYRKILTAVQDRSEQIKLELWIYSNDDVPFLLFDQSPNKQWLAVHQLNRNSSCLFEDLTLQWQQYKSNRLCEEQTLDNSSDGGFGRFGDNQSGSEDEDNEMEVDDSSYEASNDESTTDESADDSISEDESNN